MPMKVKLAPYERIFIGTTVVTNCWSEPAKFTIDGDGPVLRQESTMLAERADSPLKQVYLCVQKLYLGFADATVAQYHRAVELLIKEMPTAAETIDKANSEVAKGNFYGAIREYRWLLDIAHPGGRDWTAELTGVFQPKVDPDAPSSAPVVIRAPRRGRPERRTPRPADNVMVEHSNVVPYRSPAADSDRKRSPRPTLTLSRSVR